MRQSAWLKRLVRMLRAERSLGQAALFVRSRSSNQTNQTDRIDQIDQLPATRREMWPGTIFCPHRLVWRLEVQLVAPVAKAESRREFTLATKPKRLVEVLGVSHQFTCEKADDLRRIVARTGNTGGDERSRDPATAVSGSHRQYQHGSPVLRKNLLISLASRAIPD